MQKNTRMSLFSLYTVLFIDAMGIGILMPLLSTVLTDPTIHILLGPSVAMSTRNILYGLVFTAFFIAWFFGASFLGDLSDTAGRKKALLICMGGVSVAYLITAASFVCHSLTLLIVGRIIAGLSAGSQPIAQAAITDVCPPEKLTQSLGRVMFFFAAGLVGGPIAGGFLSNSHWVSWFSLTTPLYAVTLLGAFNFILLLLSFQETSSQQGKVTFSFRKPITILVSAFTHPKVRFLSFVLLPVLVGFNGYYFFVSVLLIHRFGFDTTQVSLYMALVGAGLAIGTAVLPGIFERRKMLPKRAVLLGVGVLGLSILTVMLSSSIGLIWAVTLPLNAGFGLAYSFLMGMFSRQVDSSQQGWVMGITGAILAFSNALITALGGALDTLSIDACFAVIVASTLIGFLLMMRHKS